MTEETEGPGAALRAAREGLGVSSREVAEALNLPIHVIEAMESNDYERLPQIVFARGYLRSYARLLELDPDAIVARLPVGRNETVTAEVAVTKPGGNTLGNTPGSWLQRNPGWVLGGGAVALVALLVVLGWWWSGSESADDPALVQDSASLPAATGLETPADDRVVRTDAVPKTAAQSTSAQNPAAQTSPVQSEPDQATAPAPRAVVTREDNATSGEDSRALSSERGAVEDKPDAVTTTSAQVATPAASATSGGVRRITEFGDDQLTFTFSDDCWVEVKSASGANLYSNLNRAGSTLKLSGQGPFRILLGYAPGVGLEFNDERVALAPHTRNNVATLVLGQ